MAFFRGTGGAGTATFEQLPLAISEGGTSATTVASARASLLPDFSGNATFVLAVNSSATDVEFVTAQSTISYSDATANFTGILQESGSNVLTSADIGVSVASDGGTMYVNRPETLDANGGNTASSLLLMEVAA